MAVHSPAVPRPGAYRARPFARPRHVTASLSFDRWYVAACAWGLGGLFIDGYAHINTPSLETFFTPWHGIFYSGFLAVAAVLGVGVGRGRAQGYVGLAAIPTGYELAALGAVIFALGGVGDMLWHITFGIEADLEALLSPTHLVLASGLALLLAAPARAAFQRSRGQRIARSWSQQLPMLLSLTFVFGLFSFFTQYFHPISSGMALMPFAPASKFVSSAAGRPLELPFLVQAPVIAGVLVQSALLVGFLIVARRRADVPFGTVTMLLGVTSALMLLMRAKYDVDIRGAAFVAAVLAGLVSDGLVLALRGRFSESGELRLLGVAVPLVTYLLYFGAVAMSGGVWWTVHLWTGAIFLAAAVGGLLALVATQIPQVGESRAVS
ncbi:MAG: hypothetical protein NVSMB2_22150 [Chloroflexota bacterium]